MCTMRKLSQSYRLLSIVFSEPDYTAFTPGAVNSLSGQAARPSA